MSLSEVEFGRLQAEVEALRRDMDSIARNTEAMAAQVAELVAVTNKGKGAFWALVTFSGGVGAMVATGIKRLFG